MAYVLDDLYRLYTERFTHYDPEPDENGVLRPVAYRPQSVCNRKEVEEIWRVTATQPQPPFFWPSHAARLKAALDMMRARVGVSQNEPIVQKVTGILKT